MTLAGWRARISVFGKATKHSACINASGIDTDEVFDLRTNTVSLLSFRIFLSGKVIDQLLQMREGESECEEAIKIKMQLTTRV